MLGCRSQLVKRCPSFEGSLFSLVLSFLLYLVSIWLNVVRSRSLALRIELPHFIPLNCKLSASFFVLVSSFFFFFSLDMSLFPSIFVPLPLYGEYVVRFSSRMVLFYLVTTSWIFDMSLCENSINQSKAPTRIGKYPFSLFS